MPRGFAIAALLLSLALTVEANEPGPPPITRKTLVGSWQAVSPDNPFVLRLEIAADGASYLVWMWDSHPILARLVSSDVHGGKVTLRFRRMRSSDLGFDNFTITATGYGDATVGVLRGKLHITNPENDDHDETIAFARPQWVNALPYLAKRAEKLLQKAQREKQ
jgi:hypothetical protein